MNITKRPLKSNGWPITAVITTAILTFLATTLAIGSFTLRQLAALQTPVTIDPTPPLLQAVIPEEGTVSAVSTTPPPATITQSSKPKLFVASKRGKTYYYPWCTGAANISDTNKVWFESQTAAQAAGYTPSKSCKDLTQ